MVAGETFIGSFRGKEGKAASVTIGIGHYGEVGMVFMAIFQGKVPGFGNLGVRGSRGPKRGIMDALFLHGNDGITRILEYAHRIFIARAVLGGIDHFEIRFVQIWIHAAGIHEFAVSVIHFFS